MAKAVYTAYATLKSGAARQREFKSSTNAVAYARQVANEGGACFVTRCVGAESKIMFNTHFAPTEFEFGGAQRRKENACEEL